MTKVLVSDEVAKNIVIYYADTMSVSKVMEKFSLGRHVVNRVLKENGVEPKTDNTKYFIKHDAFSHLTEDVAYWVGFIMADGNLHEHKSGSKVLQFGLSKKDEIHLRKFKSFLRTEKPIYECKKRDACVLAIHSKQIFSDLQYYGVTPRKSLTAEVKNITEDMCRHFWRGVFDGDGHIKKSEYSIFLTGSSLLCEQFSDFIFKTIGVRQSVRKYKDKNVYYINYTGKNSRKISELLYGDSNISLDRKLVVANEYIKRGELWD